MRVGVGIGILGWVGWFVGGVYLIFTLAILQFVVLLNIEAYIVLLRCIVQYFQSKYTPLKHRSNHHSLDNQRNDDYGSRARGGD